MISWIQRTFQQHFKWLFIGLLVIVIIAFVFITNASSGLGQTAQKVARRDFFGINLNSREDAQRLFGDAELSVYLQFNTSIRDEAQLQNFALQRQAALAVADRLGIPAASERELVAHIQSLRAFSGPDGAFDRQRYADFQDSLSTNPRLTEADVGRVLSDDVRVKQVQELLAGPGYILPQDVRAQLIRRDSTFTAAIATIDNTAFSPEIQPTDEDLQTYLEQNAARYETPAQVVVDYIDFPASAYLDQVTVTDAELRAAYDANPARFPKPADANSAAPTVAVPEPSDDFAVVRSQVEAFVRQQKANRRAHEAAADTALALFDREVTADGLPRFIEKNNLALQSSPPISRGSVPPALAGGQQVTNEAFLLGPDRVFSDAVNTQRGAAILVWKESIPARAPELADIRERVAADYVEAEKRERFAEAVRALREDVQSRLQNGEDFEQAVTAAAASKALKVEVKTPEPFTSNTPPEGVDYAAIDALTGLDQGELSQGIVSQQGPGVIVYALDKELPDTTPENPKFKELSEQYSNYIASQSGSDHLSSLVEAELARAQPMGLAE